MPPFIEERDLRSTDGSMIRTVTTTVGGAVAKAVLCHGITGAADEFGMFPKLADALARIRVSSTGFDYRGHGSSRLPQRAVTLAGEMQDLESVVRESCSSPPARHFLVASSFGAVSALRTWPDLGRLFSGVVLWNPVLDVHGTFVEPDLPWGRSNMTPAALESLAGHGYYRLDGEFDIDIVLHLEMTGLRLQPLFHAIEVPILVLHASDDTQVSFEVARQCAQDNPHARFVPVEGSDHGFSEEVHEDFAVAESVKFLERLLAGVE